MNWKSLLTPRELGVVECLKQGLTDREISAHTGLSPDTVKFHLLRIVEKLNVSTRAGLARLVAGPEDADLAGVAAKKPKHPNLNSGAADASLDEKSPKL